MNFNEIGFLVLTAASTKMAVFWDVAPSSLVDINPLSEEITASIILITEQEYKTFFVNNSKREVLF
jgi:hypothetical protein